MLKSSLCCEVWVFGLLVNHSISCQPCLQELTNYKKQVALEVISAPPAQIKANIICP